MSKCVGAQSASSFICALEQLFVFLLMGGLNSEDLLLSLFLLFSLAHPRQHSEIQSDSYSRGHKMLPLLLQKCL